MNLYVGNLPFSATADELREMFAAFGTVTRAANRRRSGNRTLRGFGFVEMSDGGEQAISAVNNADFGGRKLTVNEAKPREPRPRFDGSGHDGRAAANYNRY